MIDLKDLNLCEKLVDLNNLVDMSCISMGGGVDETMDNITDIQKYKYNILNAIKDSENFLPD